jgi:AraC-like DNA-binding protein
MFHEPQLLQLAELFNYLDDVRAWIKDRNGRISWVNRATLMLYSPDDPEGRGILGKTDHELFPAFLADQFLLDDEYVLAGNRIVDRIEMNHLPDGTFVWHLTNKIPLSERDGGIIGTAGITRPLGKPGSGASAGTAFSPVLAYMRDHHDMPITNQQMARLAHMSLRSFERKFLSCFHLTPQAYLRKLRLRMASHALVYTNQPLSVVAASCGFADQSHFSREFRRHFGRSPRQYREHYVRAGGGKDTQTAKESSISQDLRKS